LQIPAHVAGIFLCSKAGTIVSAVSASGGEGGKFILPEPTNLFFKVHDRRERIIAKAVLTTPGMVIITVFLLYFFA